MTGVFLIPDMRGGVIPGQMPTMDPELDRMYAVSNGVPELTISETDVMEEPLSRLDIVEGLGLGKAMERLMRGVVEQELGSASNEVTLRQGLMSSMLEQKLAPDQRRAIMSRACNLYRGLVAGKPPVQPDSIGGRKPKERFSIREEEKQITPEDSDELEQAIGEMLDDAGIVGLPAHELAEFIDEHGSPAVVDVLKRLGISVASNKRIVRNQGKHSGDVRDVLKGESLCSGFIINKSEKEVIPRKPSSEDPRSDPIGSRRIWNKRVVEKLKDGQWHVVGHIQGLEDPKAVPQLDTASLDRESLLHLLQQLRHIHEAGGPKEQK